MDEVEALRDNIMILKHGGSIFFGTVQEAVEASPYDKFEDAYLWYTDEEGHEYAAICMPVVIVPDDKKACAGSRQQA